MQWKDEELGLLIVRENVRAKRLVFRTKNEGVYISVPPGTTAAEVKLAVEKLRPRLLAFRQQLARPRIDLDYRIDAPLFQLSVVQGNDCSFYVHSKAGGMQLVCPSGTDFEDERIQQWLHKVVKESLRRHAKVLLPARLQTLSRQAGLAYAEVKINSSQGRWGSCSTRKSINLSCYLLLLPTHLIDYVLLHELCHTREMNHGTHFWSLLNRLTDGKALSLREELKQYRAEV